MGNTGIYGKRLLNKLLGQITSEADELTPIGGSGENDTQIINAILTFVNNNLISTNKKLQFRDSGIYIYSDADGKIKIVSDGTGNDDITFSGTAVISGGLTVSQTTKTANYSATVDDYIIGGDTSSAAITITLPSAGAVAGKIFIINDEGGAAGTNNITVATEGAETIDGAATATISTNYGTIRVYSDGTNFFTF